MIQNITDAILEDIRREREGELIDVDLLKRVVEIFLFLSTDKLNQESINCKQYLQDKLIEQTRQFYQIKS
jgi:chromosome condensin MukBEF MukE localization factor